MLKTLKTTIRAAMRSTGWDIKRHSVLARACEVMAQRGENPTFVQIGANDGILFDDLYPLVTKFGLRGLAVEPVPNYFVRLTIAYANYPSVIPVNVALHPTAKTMEMHIVSPARATEHWHHGLASFSRENVLKHGLPEDAVIPIEVGCLSFSGLVAKYLNGHPIDILVVDTEGFDAEILGMIDWTLHRPKVIQFEKKHLPQPVFDGLKAKLRGLGYRVSWANDDCSAVLPGLIEPLAHARTMAGQPAAKIEPKRIIAEEVIPLCRAAGR